MTTKVLYKSGKMVKKQKKLVYFTFFMKFFSKIFGGIKYLPYLCTRNQANNDC